MLRAQTVKPRDRLRQLIRGPRLPIDLGSLEWVDFAPGVRFHYIERGPDGVLLRALVWVEAGGEVPVHEHDVAEDVLVVEGSLALDGGVGAGVYTAGQLFHSPKGDVHAARVVGDEDCLCYVVYWPARSSD